MKLVLFGGIKGVGKTTLLNCLKKRFNDKIRLLNPGELFRRYFYDKCLKSTEDIEELIVKKILKMPCDSTVVIHWHYAVRKQSVFIPQISFARIKRLAKSGKIKQVVLLIIEAPVDLILERRLKDSEKKKRSISRSVIKKELAADENFLDKQKAIFSQALGIHKVTVFRLKNIGLKSTQFRLHQFFKKLV